METSAASDCYICRKHRGQIVVPGGTIIEDDLLSVDHAQISPGQTTAYLGYLMPEPKRHVSGLEGLMGEEAQALGLWTTRLSRALVATQGADHVYAFVLGDAISHVHVNVVERYPGRPRSSAARGSTNGRRHRAAGRRRSMPCAAACGSGVRPTPEAVRQAVRRPPTNPRLRPTPDR